MIIPHLRYFSSASPDGESILYYADGDYHVYTFATARDRNITQGLPASFVDVEDDHNNVKPPINAVGWASDSKAVLLSDAWDVWKVPVDGGSAVNLTVNGRKDAIRYQQRYALEPPDARDEGIDLSKPMYFRAYGERIRQLMSIDRRIALSRRGLKYPWYRITRSTTWKEEVNPWEEKDRLPLLKGGLLAELIYGSEARVFDELEPRADDPAAAAQRIRAAAERAAAAR